MKTIKVKCHHCGEEFDKLKKEYNRCEKQKMSHFCNRSCVAFYRNGLMSKEYWVNLAIQTGFSKYAGNRKDELSPFRIFLQKGRSSIKSHKVEIDVTYLKKIWEDQKGICPYTGIKMELEQSSSKQHKLKSLKKASLDRIDSSKDYVKGNVEFVCFAVNLAKNNFSKQDMLNFVKEIQH